MCGNYIRPLWDQGQLRATATATVELRSSSWQRWSWALAASNDPNASARSPLISAAFARAKRALYWSPQVLAFPMAAAESRESSAHTRGRLAIELIARAETNRRTEGLSMQHVQAKKMPVNIQCSCAIYDVAAASILGNC